MRRTSLLSAAALAAVLAAGCSAATTSDDSEGCGGAVIGDSIPQASDPGLTLIHEGLVVEAERNGAKVLTADANLDVNRQLSDIDSFIQRQADAVTAWPMDTTAVRPALQRADQQGMVVVTQQTPQGVDFATNLQFDDRGAGAALAAYLAEKLGPGAKVAAIIGPQQVDSFRNLAEGFAAGAEAAGLDVVETQNNPQLSPQKSAEITEQLRTRYGSELAGIFDTLNVTALASATVKDGDFNPLIVTYEGNEETRKAIEDGRITATVYVPNVLVGRTKTWAICERLAGEELPDNIRVPYLIADQDNVADIPSEAEQLEADLTFELERAGAVDRVSYGGIELPASAVEVEE